MLNSNAEFKYSSTRVLKYSNTHPMHVVAPAQRQQGQRGQVVDKHLPKILNGYKSGEHILCFRSDLSAHLSFHIKELGEKERPVEGHFKHVVPPNSRIFWQIRYWIYKQDMREDIITK